MASHTSQRIICAILLWSCSCALASPGDLRFKHLTVYDGLSQGSVNAIAEDRHGFVWLATQQGLNRYDGVQFRTFTHNSSDPNSLPADWVWSLFKDSQDRFWVGANKGGLSIFDGQHFERQAVDVATVRSIVEDRQGTLWLAADEQGLVRFEPANGKTTIYDISDLHEDAIDVKTVHHDPYGVLWLGTTGAGLLRFDPLLGRAEQIYALSRTDTVRSIVGGGGRQLWIATDESGTLAIESASGRTTQRLDPEMHPRVRVLYQDSKEALWLGHEVAGLSRQIESGEFVREVHDPARPTSLPSEHVRALFEDRNGILWVGTQRGVSLWNPLSAQFATFARSASDQDGLSENWVSNFSQHSASKFWVGTYGGGVNLVDTITGDVDHFRRDSSYPQSLVDDRVSAVFEDRLGRLWVGTIENGLSRFDPQRLIWDHYASDPNNERSLSNNAVSSIFEDRSGRLWIGTMGGGLNEYLHESDTFRSYRHDLSDQQSLCSDRVIGVFEDRLNSLWIATQGGSMCRLDASTGQFERFTHDPNNALSLSSDTAWLIAEDTLGNLWIGTDASGVNVWLAKDRAANVVKFHRFSTSNGMTSNVVYGLVADTLGYIWIGSNKGLTRYGVTVSNDGVALTNSRHFTVDDGLPDNEFNYAAAVRAQDGRLLFGGTSGFVAFHPARLPTNGPSPKVLLTDFYRLEESLPFNQQQPKFEVDFEDRLVRFEYAALNFYSASQVRYQHKLTGFDEEWVNDGEVNRMTYTNLSPGNYEFNVRASVGGGPWGPPLTITLSVAPPWWASTTANVLYFMFALVVAGCVYMSLRWRAKGARELDRMNQSLRKEVIDREAKELALEQQRQQTQRYLDVVEVLIVALDADGRVNMLNQKGARLLDMEEGAAMGLIFMDEFVPHPDRPQVQKLLSDVDEYSYSEWRIRSKEGTERLMAWHSVKLPDNATSPSGVLLSGSDVTQMRNLEKHLRDGQKMEALGTLARGVAHDFNNVLSAILGYSELAQTQITSDVSAKTPLTKLDDSVASAKEIVKNILAFGEASQVPTQLVDLSHVTSDALMLVRPVVPANVRIVESIELGIGPVYANPGQVMQILLNLSNNACQFMSESGGTLTLSLKEEILDIARARQLGSVQPGRYAVLEVQDTGPGMDAYTQARMFEPFFTTQPTGKGSGLGLSVVHGVVTSMQGHIEVTSEVGEGTTFTIYLPCREDAIPVDEYVTTEVRVDPVGDESILVVDDEPGVLEVNSMRLESFGYHVLTAQSGVDAMTLLNDLEVRIDVLVTDQSMPDMRGDELAEMAKNIRPNLRVLLVSGADHPTSIFVDRFVSKPFTGRELAEHVREQLGRFDSEIHSKG